MVADRTSDLGVLLAAADGALDGGELLDGLGTEGWVGEPVVVDGARVDVVARVRAVPISDQERLPVVGRKSAQGYLGHVLTLHVGDKRKSRLFLVGHVHQLPFVPT